MEAKNKTYSPPEFGSFAWLMLQSGYAKLNKLINEDADIKAALKDLIHHIETKSS